MTLYYEMNPFWTSPRSCSTRLRRFPVLRVVCLTRLRVGRLQSEVASPADFESRIFLLFLSRIFVTVSRHCSAEPRRRRRRHRRHVRHPQVVIFVETAEAKKVQNGFPF